jgi:flagellar hook-basal body complex protein FliE
MSPISPIFHVAPSIQAPSASSSSPSDFGDYLKASMETVEGLGTQAKQSAERFLSGEGEEIHQVAMAAQKAELSFELFMQVRNKVVSAYQEVMRMQL